MFDIPRILFTALTVIACAARPAVAEPTAVHRAAVTPRDAVLADAADGRLDEFDLAAAAIAISFARDQNEVTSYVDQVDSFSKRLERRLRDETDAPARAMVILRFLHERILTGEYDAGCCDLRKTLDDGTYNCVTGTILFRMLGEQHGLRPIAVVAPAHVRCRLEHNSQHWIVETTMRDGVSRPDKVDASARDISDVELLAKLIYNQGLRCLDQGDFASALEATELSWQLDPLHNSARENVAVVVNNWSLRLASEGEYAKAVDLLDRGQRVSPSVSLIRSNQLHVFLRWIDAERRAFRDAQAAQVIRRARDLFPDHPAFSVDSP